jgi:hypothetical protein
MSCYTLFKGWLLLSSPIGFFALLVPKRPLFDSGTVPLVLVCRLYELGHGARSFFSQFINIKLLEDNLLKGVEK